MGQQELQIEAFQQPCLGIFGQLNVIEYNSNMLAKSLDLGVFIVLFRLFFFNGNDDVGPEKVTIVIITVRM